MKILITREIPQIGLELLRKNGFELSVYPSLSAEELLRLCPQYNILLSSSKDKLDAHFLHQNKQLNLISQFAAGTDNIDLHVAKTLGIPIGHTPNAMNLATSDIAFGLMIAASRNFFGHYKRVLDQNVPDFKPTADLGVELYGKTLGVFGLGNIGFQVAKKCQAAYDMNIIYCNRGTNPLAENALAAQKVDFDTLLAQSDVLSIHADLNPETHKLFDANAFEKMKKGALLINTARGKLVDETALFHSLKNGHLFGAGLDVTDPEPMLPENPLLTLPNVCILPHIGSATVQARDEMSRLAAENIIQFVNNGTMIHQVVV